MIALVVLAPLLAACQPTPAPTRHDSASPPQASSTPATGALGVDLATLPRAELLVNGQPTGECVVVTRTARERGQGLSQIAAIPGGCVGAYFDVRPSSPTEFGMFAVEFPLDLVAVDREGRIVQITEMQPCMRDCAVYTVPAGSGGAYELLPETAARLDDEDALGHRML